MTKAVLHVTSQKLGDGASARVHLARIGVLEVAAKLSGPREDARRQCRREARRLALLHHPHIVRCVGIAETPSAVVVATELVAGGSLFHALLARQNRPLPRVTTLQLAVQLSSALAHVHATGFSSGDIKSLNCLLSTPFGENGMLPRGAVLKLCDFGLSRRLRPSGGPNDTAFDIVQLWQTTVDINPDAVAGTFAYLAPECFDRAPNTPLGMTGADVYALGVVLWELASGQVPWAGYSFGALMRVIRERRTLRWPENVRDNVGDAYVRLVERCWSTDLEERPRAADVYADLLKMYGAELMRAVPQALSSSDVSEISAAGHEDDVSELDRDGSNSSSDESTAFTSIISDDGDGNTEDDSFSIILSLFPWVSEEHGPELDGVHPSVKQSDSSDSDSSDDDERTAPYNGDEEDDADIAVFSHVRNWNTHESQADSPVTALGDLSKSMQECEVDVNLGESVVLFENFAPSKRTSTATTAPNDVHLLAANNNAKHVCFPPDALEKVSNLPAFHESSHVPSSSTKQLSHPISPTTHNQDDAQMAPSDTPAYDSPPGFLEATNELSEYDFTFRDSSSVESAEATDDKQNDENGNGCANAQYALNSASQVLNHDITTPSLLLVKKASKTVDENAASYDKTNDVNASEAVSSTTSKAKSIGQPKADIFMDALELKVADDIAAKQVIANEKASEAKVKAELDNGRQSIIAATDPLAQKASSVVSTTPSTQQRKKWAVKKDNALKYSVPPLSSQMEQELACFDEEDANGQVLYSVMRFYRLPGH